MIHALDRAYGPGTAALLAWHEGGSTRLMAKLAKRPRLRFECRTCGKGHLAFTRLVECWRKAHPAPIPYRITRREKK